MEIDTQRIRDLLDKRDDIDNELSAIFNSPAPKKSRCGNCGEEGHNARACSKPKPPPPPQ